MLLTPEALNALEEGRKVTNIALVALPLCCPYILAPEVFRGSLIH